MVREARRQRRQIDGASTDWIVVRNRLSLLSSRNKQLIAEGLNTLALRPSASARSTVLPSAWSIASCSRAD